MKTGIFFDLDGTLLNTLEDLKDSVNYALRQYGCPERSLEQIRTFVGNGARRLIALALPGEESDPDTDAVLKTYQDHYATHSQVKTKPYEGVLEALEAIGRRYPVAIVSNKPDAATKDLCARYFPGIYARGESSDCKRKPAPDMLLQAREALGVEKLIYVGDSEVDVVTAKNAGVPCLSVLWGFRDKDTLEEAGANYFCDEPWKLPEAVETVLTAISEKIE